MKGPVLIFAMALAVGILLGRLSHRPTEGELPSPASAVVPQDPTSRSGRPTSSGMLEKERDRFARYPSDSLGPLLESWTNEEVVAAFRESIKSPEGLFASEDEDSLANKLYDEWLRRDFAGALAWFEKEASRSLKENVLWKLNDAWPKEQAEKGMDFVLANADLFPSTRVWPLFGKILGSRAEQGPGAVEEFFRSLGAAGIEARFGLAVQMPEEFDFRTLSESPEFSKLYETGNASGIVRAWSNQNRDEVFDWLVESHGPASLKNLADSPDRPSQDYLKWLGGKMADLDSAERMEFYDSILGRWVQMPGDMRIFADGMKTPELQDEMRRLSLQTIYAGNPQGAFPFLESIGDPAERIAMLETAEPAKLFTQSPYFRGFSPTTEKLLTGKLKEWNASPEQIETIVKRFKQ